MDKINVRIGLRLRLSLSLLAIALYISAQGGAVQPSDDSCRIIPLSAEPLPSLNIARTGHTTLSTDGGLMVFGGHTGGFVPTATAEYLRDGAWHTVPLVYPHDHGIAIKLRSGKVMLAGGHKEPLGIGQLYSAELYDPTSHTSQGFGCLSNKRAYANAVEMADGQVVISGNWFADDGIEMFADVYDPLSPSAVRVKETSLQRAKPYILRISDDDAIIFSSLDDKGDSVDSGIVDRLNGDSYREPFLDTWQPLKTINLQRSSNQFIGNEVEGVYEWLLPVENVETGRVAIARVTGADADHSVATFSLLPTQQSIPTTIHGKYIIYSSLVCDRERGVAYLIGDNGEACIFVVAIPYAAEEPSPLTIYMTELQPLIARESTPALTPEGDLVFAGGHRVNNFTPSSAVIRLPLSEVHATEATSTDSGSPAWWLWIILLCVIAGIIAAIYIARRSRQKATNQPTEAPTPADAVSAIPMDKNLPKDDALADLFRRIEQLMDEEQLYLNPNLRASDVASRVGSNTAYVSAAVNSQCGCSFSQFLTSYRIKYAQILMREDPEMKISAISTNSGFTTDSTFFRAFRSITGMSPKEWLSAIKDD